MLLCIECLKNEWNASRTITKWKTLELEKIKSSASSNLNSFYKLFEALSKIISKIFKNKSIQVSFHGKRAKDREICKDWMMEDEINRLNQSTYPMPENF